MLEPMPTSPTRRLRLLSYNIQVGIASTRARDYLTNGWRHVLPHNARFDNLDRMAEVMREYDIVALQEADAGSLRSSHINLVQYLAERAHFPYWHLQTNRRVGRIARHSNGLLSRLASRRIVDHRLPGLIPGRGAIQAFYGQEPHDLMIVVAHLALGRRAQQHQLDYLAELLGGHRHVIVMGDMNCAESPLLERFALRDVSLSAGLAGGATYPSWKPNRQLDHILVSPSIRVHSLRVLPHSYSDHLPLAMEIELPSDFRFIPASPAMARSRMSLHE